jgi:hypothetical protein
LALRSFPIIDADNGLYPETSNIDYVHHFPNFIGRLTPLS